MEDGGAESPLVSVAELRTHAGLPGKQPVFGVDAWQMRFEKIMCKCFMPPHFGWSAGAEMVFQSGL